MVNQRPRTRVLIPRVLTGGVGHLFRGQLPHLRLGGDDERIRITARCERPGGLVIAARIRG